MASLTLESPPVETPPPPPSAPRPPSFRPAGPVDDLPAQRAVERRSFRAWGLGMPGGAVVGAIALERHEHVTRPPV